MTDMSQSAGDSRYTAMLTATIEQSRRLAESGELSRARAGLEEALAVAELRLGSDHPKLAPAMVDLATIARELGNLTEAQRQLRRAHEIVTASSGYEHPTALAIAGRLASITSRLGEPTDDLDWQLSEVGARVLGPDHAAVRGARDRLANTAPNAPRPPAAPPRPHDSLPEVEAGDHQDGPTYTPSPDTPGVYQRDEPPDEPGIYRPAARASTTVAGRHLDHPEPAVAIRPGSVFAAGPGAGARPESAVATWPSASRPRADRDHRRAAGRSTMVVASLTALALATAITVATLWPRPVRRADAGQGTPTTASQTHPRTTPTGTPSLAASGPPTDVSLVDRGASVTLTWRDPAPGTVPFLVAGGRFNSAPAPLQSLPAGHTSTTIFGLNDHFDYCFTVAAIYSIDVVASSLRTCTHRLSTVAVT
jgi:Tetratricopeptide repeat